MFLPMTGFWTVLQSIYQKTVTSIAFIPAVLSTFCLTLSFLMMSIEYDSFVIELKDRISFLLITNREEAQLVLGTLVASIISVMVFSFSMVMVVLSRASSNLSPRVLPGLISNKSHQFVLGLNLGTIVYTLIMIINFQAEGDYRIPSLGVLIAMILGIACLALFVYFIHSISQNIQVENILKQIFKKTWHSLGDAKAPQPQHRSDIPVQRDWTPIHATRAGYIIKYNRRKLFSIAVRDDLQIAITRNAGFFVVEGYPFLRVKSNKSLSEKLINEIRDCFIFSITEQFNEHYLYGFRQISEIAVKALSPSLNDPGTAVKALDYLQLLFARKLNLNEELYLSDDRGTPRLIHAHVSIQDLLFRNLVPIRAFGKHDVIVMSKVLAVLKNLFFCNIKSVADREALIAFAMSCVESAGENIQNTQDRSTLNGLIGLINDRLPNGHRIPLLST